MLPSNRDKIAAKVGRVGLGNDDILPAKTSLYRSGVNHTGAVQGYPPRTSGCDARGLLGRGGCHTADLDEIACGATSSIARKTDGTVVAWGTNTGGDLAPPAGLSGVTAVSGHGRHYLALLANGTVVGWGSNHDVPAVPSHLNEIIAVASGRQHNLALKRDGTVVGWGSFAQTRIPDDLAGVAAISAGFLNSVALKRDGTVVAWGSFGIDLPVWVPTGLAGVTAIAAGTAHILVLMSDSTVTVWGTNHSAQLDVPAGLTGVVRVVAGNSHSLVLKADGTVVAWGGNDFGQATVPPHLADVKAIAAGDNHSLAQRSDGTIVSSGANLHGQCNVPAELAATTEPDEVPHTDDLLRQATIHRWQPSAAGSLIGSAIGRRGLSGTVVPLQENGNASLRGAGGLLDIIAIAAGPHHGIALRDDGTIVAWGSKWISQGPQVDRDATVPEGLTGIAAIAAGGPFQHPHNLALKRDGTVVSWGWRQHHSSLDGLVRRDRELKPVPDGLSGVIEVATCGDNSLALKEDGTVVSWFSDRGERRDVPDGLNDVVAIAAGAGHSLVLRTNGTVLAWRGGARLDVPDGLGHVTAIAAGLTHSLALKDDGTVIAWECRDSNGGSSHSWDVPAGLAGVIGIAAGGTDSVAVMEDGNVVVWSLNTSDAPHVHKGLQGLLGIAAGGYGHNLALVSTQEGRP